MRRPVGPGAPIRVRAGVLLLAALLGASATTACAGGPEPAEVPVRSAEGLDDDAVVSTLARILRLEDHRTFDPDTFRSWVEPGRPEEVRRRAVLAAGRIGDSAAVELLAGVLETDRSAPVRADAAFALGLLGVGDDDVVAALVDAAPSGWVPVRDAESYVAAEIVTALGRLPSDRARRTVVDVLRELQPGGSDRVARVAGAALLASWRDPDIPGRILATDRYLDAADPELRWRAAYALSRAGDAAGLPYLLPRASDDDHRVRAYVARALTATRADSALLADTALAVLGRLLADRHPHVRINAVRALGTFEDRVRPAAIAALLRDDDPQVVVAAIGTLADLDAEGAEPALRRIVSDADRRLGVRGAALGALVRSGSGADLVAAWARSGDWRAYHAARALEGQPLDAALPLLRDLAAHRDPRIAVAALHATATAVADSATQQGARDAGARLLAEHADSDRLRVAAVALAGLEPVAGPDHVNVLLRAYDRAMEAVDDPAGRAAAVAAVRTLARTPDAAARSSAALDLFRRPAPADPWVRIAAAEAFGEQARSRWGPAPPAVASDEPAFYEDVVREMILEPLRSGTRPVVGIETDRGPVRVELLPDEAPLTVHNLLRLVEAGYYDDGVWHRVIPNFVLQDGAPAGAPSGGPGWRIRDEINRVRYGRGVMGMALSGPDTGGSQWFITHSPQPHLDGGYTVFGRVIDGMDAADAVLQGDPLPAVRIVR